MKSTLVDYIGEKAIVRLEKAGHIEWLACRDFDDSKPEGTKWSSAQYFTTLEDAVKAAMPEPSYWDIRIYGVYDGEYKMSHYIVEGRENALAELPGRLNELGEEEDIAKAIENLKTTWFTFLGEDKNTNIEIVPYKLGEELGY